MATGRGPRDGYMTVYNLYTYGPIYEQVTLIEEFRPWNDPYIVYSIDISMWTLSRPGLPGSTTHAAAEGGRDGHQLQRSDQHLDAVHVPANTICV